MIKALRILICSISVFLAFTSSCFAGTEPYQNFLKGKILKNDTLVVKDEKFRNPLFNWSEITNISVKNAISLRIVDEQLIDRNFSCRVALKVEYFSAPDQTEPTRIDSLNLNVNYLKARGASYHNLDLHHFTDGYSVKITILEVQSPEYGTQLPEVLQLESHILIERKYLFKPFLFIGLSGSKTGSTGGGLQRLTSGTTGSGSHQLDLNWPAVSGSEEFDLEWVSIDEDSEWTAIADAMAGNSGIYSNAQIGTMFRNNATRITTAEHSYQISLLYNAKYIAVRLRQVQYSVAGLRLEGDWEYKQNTDDSYSIWPLDWHQQNLNWQYSAAYAEEGKKKEVVSYFDGSLRGRQTVTLNNSDLVAVVQENVYDEFGRAAASILPAPVKEGSGQSYLHYFPVFNQNVNGSAYSFSDLNTLGCEPSPNAMGTASGASRYYSPQNPFMGLKPYNKYIPDAEGFPLSLTQYTADNTGRIKIQGGVGPTFQPNSTGQSHTTKYFYGKPYQWELDRIFGNDAGYAEHYLKNMVVDPNGQISISYLNAGGKTIATALTGKSPAQVDSLHINANRRIERLETSTLLKPDQFQFDASSLKLSASTTYLASVSGVDTLKYSIQKLISRYPGGAFQPCSNCYYDLTIQVKNDCGTVMYSNTDPIQIGSITANPADTALHTGIIPVLFDQIGEYYISFDFVLSKNVIEHFTDEFISQGQDNGAVAKKEVFIKKYLNAAHFEDCFADCKTAVAKLGSRTDFMAMFRSKFESMGDTTSYYDGYADSLFTSLQSRAYTLAAGCDISQISPCEPARLAMLDDVSLQGQYALFDSTGTALETVSNILFLYFKHGAFNTLPANHPLRMETLVTKADGSGSFSPYDADFSLADLIQYWQPDWAERFLPFHPEYCKLQFCNNNTASAIWDEKLKETDLTADLPGKFNGLTFNRSSLSWLLDADPFFQTGGAGSSYKAAMQADLSQYSSRILGQNTRSNKTLQQFVDLQLYCGDPTGNTNISGAADVWDHCTPSGDCRIDDREWQLYRDAYLDVKLLYFQKVRSESANCVNACPVGTPVAVTDTDVPAQNCVYDGPTVNSDKAVAMQDLSNVLDNAENRSAIEMWLHSSNYGSRQFISATPDHAYMLQACFNGALLSVDVFTLNQTAPDNIGFVLSKHITANIGDILPLKPWVHLVIQNASLIGNQMELWVNGKKYAAVEGAPSAGCSWGVTSNPLNLPENFSSIQHLRLYHGRTMAKTEIEFNAASTCFLAQDHTDMTWYRFNVQGPPVVACAAVAILSAGEQLSSTSFRETDYESNTQRTYTFVSGSASVVPDVNSYCTNENAQLVFRPCVDVYFNSIPAHFNNVWQITCTEQLVTSCEEEAGDIYVDEQSFGNYYANTVGSTHDVYTVYEGYTPLSGPPYECPGDGYQAYYDCLTVHFSNTGNTTHYSNVWVYVCYGVSFEGVGPGGAGRSAAARTTVAATPGPLSSVLIRNLKANLNAGTDVAAELAKVNQAKAADVQVLSDYQSKKIYLVSKQNPVSGNSTAQGNFGAAVLKSNFTVQINRGYYGRYREVYVAEFTPQGSSLVALENQTKAKMMAAKRPVAVAAKNASRTSSIATVSATGENERLNDNGICVSLLDELYSQAFALCNNNPSPYLNEFRRSTIALLDDSGSPAVATQDVTVTVRYVQTVVNGGISSNLFDYAQITIPAGQSWGYYNYQSKTYRGDDQTNCVADTQSIDCISAVAGADFCNLEAPVSLCLPTPPSPQPSCSESLKTKTSRFLAVGAVDVAALNVADYTASGTAQLQSQFISAAQGQAENWMLSLAEGLNGMSTETQELLKAKLMELSVSASDVDHPFGASTLPTGKSVDVNGHLYTSFGGVIKAVTGVNAFSNTLNPWLIAAPLPYYSQQQATEVTISTTNAQLCHVLDSLNTGYATAETFHAGLVNRYGASMTLSLADFRLLLSGCSNCKYLLAKDLLLPVFLQPGAKGCITRTEYQAALSALAVDFGQAPDPAWSNYETIVSNYLNQRWGFTLSYDQYQTFAESTENQLCNVPPYSSVDVDDYAAVKTMIELAHGYGTQDYLDYLAEQERLFRNAYLKTCGAAQAEARLSAKQNIYHYTLYYYDLAGNLVRTVPPEGVSFLTDAEMKAVEQVRNNDLSSCTYNGPDTASNETVALQTLSATLDSTTANALELWTYSDLVGSRQFIATTPDFKYMLQACQNGHLLNIDVFTLNQTSADNVSITLSNSVTADISDLLPMRDWTHIVVQGTDLSRGNLSLWVNGKLYDALAGEPSAGCAWEINSNPISMPKNFSALKYLRLYSGRLMTAAEIKANAESICFAASDTTAMTSYRFNVPEAGGPTTIAYNTTQESRLSPVYPLHGLTTSYAYNATNQVMQQHTPDGGTSRFWYDYLSRLVASQNAKQAVPITGSVPAYGFSYTRYDVLGRIVEVGQKETSFSIGLPHYLDTDKLGLFNGSGANTQLTQTIYDEQPDPATVLGVVPSLVQNNLRKRVAASIYRETPTSANINASYYSYDLAGNVQTLYQQVDGLGFKRLDYEYDLVSGKVNFLAYQHGNPDAFYYQYGYDAENQLIEASSSVSANINSYGRGSSLSEPDKKIDASYEYYLHGPLARMELGGALAKVQGSDYAYTLQGWLKGVNGSRLHAPSDIGLDGATTGKDALAYSLGYYTHDYTPIGGTAVASGFLNYQSDTTDYTGRNLYNGNISNSTYAIAEVNNNNPSGYTYRYDQLNRLKAFRQHNIGTTSWNSTSVTNNFKEDFNYDGNGNILSLQRRKGSGVRMDSLIYQYNTDTNGKLVNNQLAGLRDEIDSGESGELKGNTQYRYDEIGNLIKDSKEGISNINWTVYGKIRQITNVVGHINYLYDASGNRVKKDQDGSSPTWYIRDAQGNILATYGKNSATGEVLWQEQQLYGSSRLGMWKPNLNLATSVTLPAYLKWQDSGNKFFELNNHLGNVMVVITDNRLQEGSAYKADVVSANDYYAFGGQMPGRKFQISGLRYRYGFNGKENDNDVKGEGNQQDYGMRIYDPRIGKFLSVDPITRNYPELTPYQFASNRPIDGIDQDGLEFSAGPMPFYSGNTIAVNNQISRETNSNKRNQMISAYHKIDMVQLRMNLGPNYVAMLIANPAMLYAGIGSGLFSGAYNYSTNKGSYEVKKNIFSGFIGGSFLALGNGFVSNLMAGASGGGISELLNQSVDETFGVKKGEPIKTSEFNVSLVTGAIAGPLGGMTSKEVGKLFNNISRNLIQKTETSAFRNSIKKGILERIPNIGARQLKTEINNEISKIQQGILKEVNVIKAIVSKSTSTGLDVGQEKSKENQNENNSKNK